MNEHGSFFQVVGIIENIEEKPTRTGGVWWLVRIRTGPEVTVRVPCFRLPVGGPLQPGEAVRVEGTVLENERGFVQLRVSRFERVLQPASPTVKPIPLPSRGGNGKPVTQRSEDNGGLPF